VQLGVDARWFSQPKAQNAYDYALKYSSKKRYGLSAESISNIERLEIHSYRVANEWLKERLPNQGTVQIVYSESEVCVVSAEEFLAHWFEIFVPARDDAVIIHNLSTEVFFYCHEEELEFGFRADLLPSIRSMQNA
jgi:hypothetical protein